MYCLTRKADYGLRLMLEVAAQTEGSITVADVAERKQIPYEYLRKVAQTLASQGLLATERGFRGGVSLARPAETITLLDIVRAFESPALNRCTVDPSRCDLRDVCAVYPVWVEAQSEVDRVLGGAHLSGIIDRQKCWMRGPPVARARVRPSSPGEEGTHDR